MKFEVGQTIFTTYYGCTSYAKVIRKVYTTKVKETTDWNGIINNITCERVNKGSFATYYNFDGDDLWFDQDSNEVAITFKRIPCKRNKNRNFALYD